MARAETSLTVTRSELVQAFALWSTRARDSGWQPAATAHETNERQADELISTVFEIRQN